MEKDYALVDLYVACRESDWDPECHGQISCTTSWLQRYLPHGCRQARPRGLRDGLDGHIFRLAQDWIIRPCRITTLLDGQSKLPERRIRRRRFGRCRVGKFAALFVYRVLIPARYSFTTPSPSQHQRSEFTWITRTSTSPSTAMILYRWKFNHVWKLLPK